MTTRTQRESLKAQLLDTRRMRELAGDHPLMSLAFREREQELQGFIEALPLGNKEARTVLFFSGEPVQGSMGIDTSEIQVPGIFKGILLESWRFDFVTKDGQKISGKIDDELSPEKAAELNREFFNLPATAILDRTSVLFKNGRARTTHTLKNLERRIS